MKPSIQVLDAGGKAIFFNFGAFAELWSTNYRTSNHSNKSLSNSNKSLSSVTVPEKTLHMKDIM